MKPSCRKRAEQHLAGASVLRGPLGFGHSGRLHTTKVLRLSEDLPIVIEIVDSPEKNRPRPAAAGRRDERRPGHAREAQGRANGPGKPG
jgi:uncharacterized protein DUF190